MLNEDVKEFVVEGFVPWLAGEHLTEVGASLTHDRLEVDHGGALGGHRHVLRRCRDPDDVCPVVGEHRLVPCDAQLELWVVLGYEFSASIVRTRFLLFGLVAEISPSV